MTTLIKDDITTTWVDITDDLSLSTGISYVLQNISSYNIFINESASTPPVGVVGHSLSGNDSWAFKADSLKGLYVRCSEDNKVATIIVTQLS